jgi:drug/metabolite transporter (DMT)-like permease
MEPVQKPMYALGLRLLATMVLTTLMMVVKYTAGTGVAFPEILFWRQVPSIVLILAWLTLRGELRRLKSRRLPAHARRALLGGTGMFFTFGAPILLPLAVATTFGFTTPVFAVILSALLLKERSGPVRWLAVALGFAGVVIITQPGHSVIPPLGAAVGLGAGFMVALISIQIRDLGRTEESLSIVFWFAAISTRPAVLCQHAYGLAVVPAARRWGSWTDRAVTADRLAAVRPGRQRDRDGLFFAGLGDTLWLADLGRITAIINLVWRSGNYRGRRGDRLA